MTLHTERVAVNYGDLLAANVRAAQARTGIDQERLAERMRALGHTAWRRQTVARVRESQRRLTAEEILGLALALETSVAALLRPSGDESAITLPSGLDISAGHIMSLVYGRNQRPLTWDEDRPVMTGVGASFVRKLESETGSTVFFGAPFDAPEDPFDPPEDEQSGD